MTLFFLILGSHLFIQEPAWAVIRQQQEAPGQMLYQSRHTLPDETGKSWQVVLFKRVKNEQIKTLDLRLVGFPDQAVFIHPQNLEISTPQGKLLEAEDQFAKKSPAPNVGEYNLKEVLPQLSSTEQVKLNLPLEDKRHTLTLPAPVILEWQELLK
ncbi:conserved hypothetical protein [Planktothrix serta PCC 8927]|uniref:DUF3122 domain-containing protein n=2 Tax=Planktothrix TaxID=54304 RepID=A0A7Z9DY58_9CYAN|nr:conserved hypothetical protein [Planktothrix serta PCC 8927]